MILVGTESNYLSDIHPEVEEYQTVSESYLEKAIDLSRVHPEVEKAKHYSQYDSRETFPDSNAQDQNERACCQRSIKTKISIILSTARRKSYAWHHNKHQ
jgi:hypothetical protein